MFLREFCISYQNNVVCKKRKLRWNYISIWQQMCTLLIPSVQCKGNMSDVLSLTMVLPNWVRLGLILYHQTKLGPGKIITNQSTVRQQAVMLIKTEKRRTFWIFIIQFLGIQYRIWDIHKSSLYKGLAIYESKKLFLLNNMNLLEFTESLWSFLMLLRTNKNRLSIIAKCPSLLGLYTF